MKSVEQEPLAATSGLMTPSPEKTLSRRRRLQHGYRRSPVGPGGTASACARVHLTQPEIDLGQATEQKIAGTTRSF